MKKPINTGDFMAFILFMVLLALALVVNSCMGKSDLPTFWVDQKSSNAAVHYIDRQIKDITLDTRQPGMVVLSITTDDKVQIGAKVVDVQWSFAINLQEGKRFKILK